MATPGQITVIKIAQKEFEWTDEEYRGFLYRLAKKKSCTLLTDGEARKVIEEMVQMGFVIKGKGKVKRLRPSPPSDGKETISESQQDCIESFRKYLKWDLKQMQEHSKAIAKIWWPQTRAQAVKLVFNLFARNAQMIFRNIQFLDKSKLTPWERDFLFFNKKCDGKIENAHEQIAKYLKNKNKRGHRTAPDFSMLKLLEILIKRPEKSVSIIQGGRN